VEQRLERPQSLGRHAATSRASVKATVF